MVNEWIGVEFDDEVVVNGYPGKVSGFLVDGRGSFIKVKTAYNEEFYPEDEVVFAEDLSDEDLDEVEVPKDAKIPEYKILTPEVTEPEILDDDSE